MSHTLEEWRPIAGLEELYEVSNLGRVRSLPRISTHLRQNRLITKRLSGKLLKPAPTKGGYLVVNVSFSGRAKTQYVHCLVASAFLSPCPGEHGRNGWHIDHINGDKNDNRVENLRWLTHRENNSTPAVKARHRARPRNAKGSRFVSWTNAHPPA